MKLTINEISIEKIKLPSISLKEHPEKQIKQIAASIEQFGFNDPIAVDDHYNLIEGVGRVLAAKLLNLKTIPTIRLKHLSDNEKRAYRIAHNKICLNSGFNLEAIAKEFDILCKLNNDLPSLTGFESIEIEDLTKLPHIPDLAPELTELFKSGKQISCPNCGEVINA